MEQKIDKMRECNLGENYADVEKWSFGVDNDRLLRLVLEGEKTATCYPYEDDVSKPNDISIITASNGEPKCLVQTVDIKILPFYKMTWELAKLEGENNNLAEWTKDHKDYFTSVCENFNDNTLIVFEQFKVLKIF